jgi:hypothetical protein
MTRKTNPETDAVVMPPGGILLFWPSPLDWLYREYEVARKNRSYWMMSNINRSHSMILILLGWELSRLSRFGALGRASGVFER